MIRSKDGISFVTGKIWRTQPNDDGKQQKNSMVVQKLQTSSRYLAYLEFFAEMSEPNQGNYQSLLPLNMSLVPKIFRVSQGLSVLSPLSVFFFFFFLFFSFFLARFIADMSVCVVCDSSIVDTCPSIPAARFAFCLCLISFLCCFVVVLSGEPKQNQGRGLVNHKLVQAPQ